MVKFNYEGGMPRHSLIAKKDFPYFPKGSMKDCYIAKIDARFQVFTCAYATFEKPCDDFFHKCFTESDLHNSFDEQLTVPFP